MYTELFTPSLTDSSLQVYIISSNTITVLKFLFNCMAMYSKEFVTLFLFGLHEKYIFKTMF